MRNFIIGTLYQRLLGWLSQGWERCETYT
jgi:hypothetical protein